MYRPRATTENVVVLGTGTDKLDLSVWDVECLDRNRGCNGLGCHYVILRNGDVEAKGTYATLRAKHEVGNTDPRYNHNSIFVRVVGSDDQYTQAQENALKGLIEYLQELYPEAEPLFHTTI